MYIALAHPSFAVNLLRIIQNTAAVTERTVYTYGTYTLLVHQYNTRYYFTLWIIIIIIIIEGTHTHAMLSLISAAARVVAVDCQPQQHTRTS